MSGDRGQGLRPFDARLALLLALLLGSGWAVMTGAGSGWLERAGFFAVGALTGALTGLRFADAYRGAKPRWQSVLRVCGYGLAVAVVALMVEPGAERFTAIGEMAGAGFAPTMWVVGVRVLHAERTDRELAAGTIPPIVVGTLFLYVAGSGGPSLQLASVGCLTVLSLVVWTDHRRHPKRIDASSRAVRVDRPADPSRRRVWARWLVVGTCLIFAAVLVGQTHTSEGVDCGTVMNALDHAPGTGCERPLRASVAGILLLVHMAIFVAYGTLTGRGPRRF